MWQADSDCRWCESVRVSRCDWCHTGVHCPVVCGVESESPSQSDSHSTRTFQTVFTLDCTVTVSPSLALGVSSLFKSHKISHPTHAFRSDASQTPVKCRKKIGIPDDNFDFCCFETNWHTDCRQTQMRQLLKILTETFWIILPHFPQCQPDAAVSNALLNANANANANKCQCQCQQRQE